MSRCQITAFIVRLLGIGILVYLLLTAIPVCPISNPDLNLPCDSFGHPPQALNALGKFLYVRPLIYPLFKTLAGVILIFAAAPISRLLWMGIADKHD